MFQKNLISLAVVACLYSSSAFAQTLQQDIVEVLNTNPVIQERLKNFRATQQDLNIAEAGYYPSLDLRASAGYNRAGELKSGTIGNDDDWNHNVRESDYRNYESSLTFTQNLFNGFGTSHQVDYEESRILAAAYKYLEKSNDMAFQMTNVYIEVLKSNELVETARENVQINESIYSKVKDLFESGLTTDSEVKKIQSTLSLARSNLTVVKNNAEDSEYKYRRILGRLPDLAQMSKPALDVGMPSSIERAALYAINNNPSLLVSKYNIKGAESLWKQRKKDYYPKVDLELSQVFNDHDELGNGFDQPDDRFNARVVMTYNLFRGGADSALVQQHVSKISQEIDIQRDLKRQVVEGLDLSWNAYYMVEKQLKDLRDYSTFSEKTLELYKEEYDLGRRSLLDLLSSQNDVINSRSQIIKAEYDQLFAKYRILDAMGILVSAVNGDSSEFSSKVNLNASADAKEILDTLPIELDVDHDKIADNIDLCDNSKLESNIMPYGCIKVQRDDDKDGVLNEKDECPLSVVGAKVDSKGCENKVVEKVEVIETAAIVPDGYNVDDSGEVVSVTMSVNFEKNSVDLPVDLDAKITEFSNYLKSNPEIKANIVGHTSRTSVSSGWYNRKLSKMRALRVKEELITYGIDESRLSSDGKGFAEPVADNETDEGRVQNRRVEIELIREES